MSRLKAALAAVMSIVAMTANAEMIDCVTIYSADGEQKFPISDIKEITFADGGMTVVKTDGASSTFVAGWQMKFGLTELSVDDVVSDISSDVPAVVYTVDGRMVGSYSHMSDLHQNDLEPGTYVIVINGKTIKIQR